MNAKIVAEEILILMAYGVEMLMMPSFRRWDQSYEGWLYHNGLLSRIHYLEAQKFLERKGSGKDWVFQITKAGRARVCGGRNPDEYWNRKWDGWWRMLVFDLPLERQRSRATLIRWLRQNGFGYLQDSVWITPDPVKHLTKSLKQFRDDVEAVMLMESRCASGYRDASLVKGAWRFEAIQEGYQSYLQFASEAKQRLSGPPLHPRDLFALLREERAWWMAAFALDPLLPRRLWPSDYMGPRAWKSRQELLRLTAAHARSK